MKPSIKILIGAAIAASAWIPISFAERGDIPFGAAIVGVIGSMIGVVVVLVAVVQWLLAARKRRLERK